MGSELTDAERLIKLETELVAIRDVVIRMETKLDTWQANYVPRAELNEMFKSRDDKIEQLRTERQVNKQAWPNWLLALFALCTFLSSLWPHIPR